MRVSAPFFPLQITPLLVLIPSNAAPIARGRATQISSSRSGISSRYRAAFVFCRELGGGRAGDYRWLEGLLRPARPRPTRGRCNALAHLVLTWIVIVCLEPEALGARNLPWPAPRPSAPLPSAGTDQPPQRLSTPCSASARACDPPTTRDIVGQHVCPGRPGASHRPPLRSVGAECRPSSLPGQHSKPIHIPWRPCWRNMSASR